MDERTRGHRNPAATDWRGYYSDDGRGLQLVYADEQFVPDPTGLFGSRPVQLDLPGTPIMRQIPVTRAKEEKSDHPVAAKLMSILKKFGKKSDEEAVHMASPPSAKFFLRTVDTTELPVTYPESATLDEIRPMRRSDSFLTTVYVGKMKPKNIRVRLFANDVLEVILRQIDKSADGMEKDQTVRITLPPNLDLQQLKTTYDGEKALSIEAPYMLDSTVEAVQQRRPKTPSKITVQPISGPAIEVPDDGQPKRVHHRPQRGKSPGIELPEASQQQPPLSRSTPAPSASLSPLITEQILSILSSGGRIHDGESFLLQAEGQLFLIFLFQFHDGYSRPRAKLHGNEFKMKISESNSDEAGAVTREIGRRCSIPAHLTVIDERVHFHSISKTILAVSARVQSSSAEQPQQRPIQQQQQQQRPVQQQQRPVQQQQPMTVRQQLNQVIPQQHASRVARMASEHERTRRQESSQVVFLDNIDEERGFKIYSDGRQSPVIVKK